MPQPKSPAAKKAKAAPKKAASAPRSAPERAAAKSAPDGVPDPIAAALETLHRGVLLRRERLQEVVDDAVTRGRMTRTDAEDLVQSLVQSGRRQAEDLLSEVEKLVERGRREVAGGARTARRRAIASPVTREVDRARRKAGVPGFPIIGYDDLTAAQIVSRLADLDGPQLRKVRDHERRNANRKGVLSAIEKRLK